MVRNLLGVIVVFVFATAAIATPTINAGDLIIALNSAGETVCVDVTGGDAVQGLEFNILVGGGTSGPAITGVDVLNGTVFDGNNGGGFAGYVNTYDAYKGVVTAAGTVAADGKIATITFDSTGITSYGIYDFSLTNTEGPTHFAGIAANLTDGQIIVTINGDSNGDGTVSLADLTILATNYGLLSDMDMGQGDFNNDHTVSLADLTILATKYGQTAPGAPGGGPAPIPEPASLSMLAIGGFALLRRKS